MADTLDAITSDRSYHRAASFASAHAEIARHGGTQFDPEVLRAFLAVPLDEWRRIRATIGDAPTPLAGHLDPLPLGRASSAGEGGPSFLPDGAGPAGLGGVTSRPPDTWACPQPVDNSP